MRRRSSGDSLPHRPAVGYEQMLELRGGRAPGSAGIHQVAEGLGKSAHELTEFGRAAPLLLNTVRYFLFAFQVARFLLADMSLRDGSPTAPADRRPWTAGTALPTGRQGTIWDEAPSSS